MELKQLMALNSAVFPFISIKPAIRGMNCKGLVLGPIVDEFINLSKNYSQLAALPCHLK